jgi:hypothetical protein
VRWHVDGELWAVCRRRDIQTVGKDPDTFCSGSGVLMADRGWEIAAQDSILYLDPPSHGPYRKLVSRASRPSQGEPDLAGLPADDKKILRDKLVQRLQMQKRFISLVDDVGTEYRPTGGGSGGGGDERRGNSDFAPGVPAEAQRLTVQWDEMEFEVPLPPTRDSS